MKKLLIVAIFVYSFLGGTVVHAKKPLDLRCDSREHLIRSVSDNRKMIEQVDYIMWRESRCRQVAHNPTDPNGGSYGLFQINGYWCKKNKYNPTGWLQAKGILNTCEDLFIPEVNLRAGLAMWNYSQERNKCGWRPWATRC
jgi:hypothetical protein